MSNKEIKKNNVENKKNDLLKNIGKYFRRYFYYLVALEVVLILGLGYWFFVRLEVDRVFANVEAHAELSQKSKNKLVSLKNDTEKMSKILSAYDELSLENKEKINNIVPSDREIKELFSELYNITKISGLILNSIEVVNDSGEKEEEITSRTKRRSDEVVDDSIQVSSNLAYLDISLEIEGINYTTLKVFLSAIENNSRLMDVQTIGYNPKEEEAELLIKTYYLRK